VTWLDRVHVGDCRELMRRMAVDGVRVDTVVTSPPYYGLRDYQVDGQIGLEASIDAWVASLVEVFSCARDLLTDTGTLWLNLGDSYCSSGGSGHQGKHGYRAGRANTQKNLLGNTAAAARLKPKDLMGQPWRVAFALQAAGWYLRRDIIWHKPNPMPESARDRPTTAHEYVFMLSKAERYHYDPDAIAEPVTGGAHSRGSGVNPKAGPRIAGWAEGAGSHSAKDHAKARQDIKTGAKFGRGAGWRSKQNESFSAAVVDLVDTRNARSVWTIPTEATSFAHFACFPRALPRRCILAGCPPGGIVLDPFMGSGTTAQVARQLGRRFIGCELNPEYAAMLEQHRDDKQAGLEL
jgi:DNA modification methylase